MYLFVYLCVCKLIKYIILIMLNKNISIKKVLISINNFYLFGCKFCYNFILGVEMILVGFFCYIYMFWKKCWLCNFLFLIVKGLNFIGYFVKIVVFGW